MNAPSKSTPNFGEATYSFEQAGFPLRALLPIAPVDAKISSTGDLDEKVLGKAPGRWNARARDWRGLGGGYLTRGVKDPKDQDAFASRPTPNVGNLGRYAPANDSDAETEDARLLVERALIETFGRDAAIAERLRGKGPRRLYAFLSAVRDDQGRIVRTRHLKYRMRGEDERHSMHKLDVIGYGAQYLIAGEHQSGDRYEWHPDFDLCALHADGRLLQVENNDIARFIEAFKRELGDEGGTLVSQTGGRAPGEERDYSKEDPIFPVNDILDGLDQIPNNEDNFATRDEFVSFVSAVVAALGREAEPNFEHIASWACEDQDWCPDEYFYKIWNSLQQGVRCDRYSLDRRFKRAGVFASARAEFTGDARELTKDVRTKKAAQRDAAADLLDKMRSRYVFRPIDSRTGTNTPQMRSVWDPAREWPVLGWWHHETTEQSVELVQELQEIDRWSDKKQGMWVFLRDLERTHPDNFYTAETRHPSFGRGEIVREENPDGTFTREINMRFEPRVQFLARRPPANARQARRDVDIVLEFIDRVFTSKLAHYELDTLAYMAQSGKRPGHMLFLVGGQGVGKSIYAEMLISMFDGNGKEINSRIDGTKLTSDSARRFAWAKVEGCRIISVKELPDGSSATSMAAITSSLKQIVDPGPDGDFVQIEQKGKDSRTVRNHARIVMTSNYKNAVLVEEQDRRIFYVSCGIVPEDKPSPEYYEALAEVTTNPERLAAFWRYLLDRDVSHYKATNPPPASVEKQEAQIASMTDPSSRHMAAAIEVYRRAKRRLFTPKELAMLMMAMAENEFNNTNRQVDDRRTYDWGETPSVTKQVEKYAIKIREIKSNGSRLNVYALRTAKPLIEELKHATGPEIKRALERDREENRMSSGHAWSMFSGPLTPRDGTQ